MDYDATTVRGLAKRVACLQWLCAAQLIAFIAYLAVGRGLFHVQAQDSIVRARG